ncbi:hypothetical protein ACN28S_24850 [Cystobacter fuscus]
MRSIFGKTMLAVGAIAAVSGCGPSEELEQGAGAADTRAVSDPRTCGNDNLTDEQVAEMEARFEVAKARQAMGGRCGPWAPPSPCTSTSSVTRVATVA